MRPPFVPILLILITVIHLESIFVSESVSGDYFPEDELALADQLYLEGRYSEAIEQYNYILQRIDNAAVAVWGLSQIAGCYEYLGDYDQASDKLNTLVTSYQNFVLSQNVHFRLANALFRAKKYGHAVDKLQYVITQFPEDPRTPVSLFQLGYACQQLKLYERAVTYYRRAQPHLPLLVDYIEFFIAQCQIARGEYEHAETHLKHIDEMYPESVLNWQVREQLAECYYQMEAYDPALTQYRRLLNAEKDKYRKAEYHYRISEIYEQQGNTSRAIKNYQLIAKRYPQTTAAYRATQRLQKLNVTETYTDQLLRAEIISNQGFWKQAIAIYEHLLAENPHHPENDKIYYQIGRTYERMDLEASAITVYRELIRQHPRSKWRPYAEKRICECYRKMGEDDLALEHYQHFIKNHPGHWRNVNDAYYEIGRIYERQHQLKPAIRTYETLYKRNPGRKYGSLALWRMVMGYYKLGDYANSIQACQRMIRNYRGENYAAQATYWIGKNYQKMGNQFAASEAFQKVIEDYPDTYYARRAQAQLGQVDWNQFVDMEIPYLDEQAKTAEDSTTQERLSLISPVLRIDEIRASNVHLQKGELLLDLGLYEEAYTEFQTVEDESGNNLHFLYALAKAYDEIQFHDHARRCAEDIARQLKRDIPRGIERLRLPICYAPIVQREARLRKVDPLLICALIRQESAYNPRATSPANARGLMQIIPPTARQIVRELDIPQFEIEDLYLPENSIHFGTYYFSQQLHRFDNQPEVALAAYNGGPGNAAHWLSSNTSGDIDEFVEDIKFSETRNYVKIVMNNYWKYIELYRM
ncbi:MAG: outer membrane protein assembly factor BamD [Gemmatimonadetes bacterium]|nr:MAG: outer membrane protein assembly factor BamD [Gemmatimonadota bacterium]